MVMGELTQKTDLLIVGGGPGGYAAAFRAADMGMEVTVVDEEGKLGGVCLYCGCIPSKALLYLAELIYDTRRAAEMGLAFQPPQIDLAAVRNWRDQVVGKMSKGLETLAKNRDVQLFKARAAFAGPDRVKLQGSEVTNLFFDHAIVATGSHPTPLPGVELRAGGRIMDSTGALALPDIPETLLIVGGGYIGMELGQVYAAFGSKVTVVEMTDSLLPGIDKELVRPLARKLKELFANIYLKTKVKSFDEQPDQVKVVLEGEVDQPEQSFARVLIAVGRRPNSQDIGLETTKVQVDQRGFIEVDERRRTADERIYAIGDVAGGALLAHKAMHEGRVAVEAIAGQPAAFDYRAIPAVVYTEPSIAWTGLTEDEAKKQGIPIQVIRFPWSASGRATSMGANEGLTKVLFDPETGRVLGVGIVGREAGELISEGSLAVEMGALAEDVALTMHPHPTLSETVGESAEAFLGSPVDIMPPRKRGATAR